jgi:CheY-like chemotaxis protein
MTDGAVALSGMTASSGELDGLRILVVDDCQDGAELLVEALTELGADVRIAFDGETGLAAAREFLPDAVLLDLALPDIDGYQVARRLQQESRLTGTRIVAVTGYGRSSDQEKTRAAGFAAHVVKPIDLELLVSMLAEGVPSSPER